MNFSNKNDFPRGYNVIGPSEIISVRCAVQRANADRAKMYVPFLGEYLSNSNWAHLYPSLDNELFLINNHRVTSSLLDPLSGLQIPNGVAARLIEYAAAQNPASTTTAVITSQRDFDYLAFCRKITTQKYIVSEIQFFFSGNDGVAGDRPAYFPANLSIFNGEPLNKFSKVSRPINLQTYISPENANFEIGKGDLGFVVKVPCEIVIDGYRGIWIEGPTGNNSDFWTYKFSDRGVGISFTVAPIQEKLPQ